MPLNTTLDHRRFSPGVFARLGARLYQGILKQPFVYNVLRPVVVGGIDVSSIYRRFDIGPDDVVLDVGCGTGIALDCLHAFKAYYGFDVDVRAIGFASKKHRHRANVSFVCNEVTLSDIQRIRPTKIIMAGLLHHLNDSDAVELMKIVSSADSVRGIYTHDVVYLSRHPVNNLLAWLDRGRFCRRAEGYVRIVQNAGCSIKAAETFRCHPRRGIAKYFTMKIEPAAILQVHDH